MIYKAMWPMAGLPLAWMYAVSDEHLLPFARPTSYLPATKSLYDSLFHGAYTTVYFDGSVMPGGLYVVKDWVRREDWVEMEKPTGEEK